MALGATMEKPSPQRAAHGAGAGAGAGTNQTEYCNRAGERQASVPLAL